MNRYDLSKGTYKPSLNLARYNDGEGYHDGMQWGDLVAVAGDRIGVRWETKAPRNDLGVIESGYVFEVLPAVVLAELTAEAEGMLAEWGREAAAEQAAERSFPQHMVW